MSYELTREGTSNFKDEKAVDKSTIKKDDTASAKSTIKEEEKAQDKGTMRFKSTGLGKTMLHGNVEGVYFKGGAMVISIKTTSPVLWHMRVACSRKGLWRILMGALKFNIILHAIGLKKDAWPEDF